MAHLSQWHQSVGGGGQLRQGGIPPTLFPTPKKVRGDQMLNIVIVVRLEIKNLEEFDFYRLKL